MRLWRWAFAPYAVALFIATHWPKLQVHGPIPRSDLVVHLAVFGGWGILATLCGFFGEPLSRRNIVRTWMLGLVYAAIDESLQAIPVLQRVAALDDYAANATGITLAAVLLAVVAEIRNRNKGPGPTNNLA